MRLNWIGCLLPVSCAAAVVLGSAGATVAAPRHHHVQGGVHYAHRPASGGRQALVSDGPGTGFGFHHVGGGYAGGPSLRQARQVAAVRESVETDAITSGGFRSGFLGDDVAASVPYSNYGVFSGSDGYGSPFFAGYYGHGDGEDLGDLGTTYADD